MPTSQTATVTANNIIELLAEKHADDVFVRECKSGQTWGAKHLRLDAWVMRKSWAKPKVTGYEIKVSRGDFSADEKWHEYLRLCNQFYWVCPYNLIQPNEVPSGTGLLWVSKAGTRIYTKIKASWNDVTVPESLYRYILMSRCKILEPDEHLDEESEDGYWKRWLDKRREDQIIGMMVSRRVAQILTELRTEQFELQGKVNKYERIKDHLRDLGIDPDSDTWSITNRLTEMAGDINNVKRRTTQAMEALRKLEESLAAYGGQE